MLSSPSISAASTASSAAVTSATQRRVVQRPAPEATAATPAPGAAARWDFSQMKPRQMKAWAQQAMAQGEISLQGYLALTAMPATLRRDASGGMSVVPFSELPPDEQPTVDYLGMVSGHLEFLRRNPSYAQQDPPAMWEQLLGAMQAQQGSSRSKLDVQA